MYEGGKGGGGGGGVSVVVSSEISSVIDMTLSMSFAAWTMLFSTSAVYLHASVQLLINNP